MKLFADENFPRGLFLGAFRTYVAEDKKPPDLIHLAEKYKQGLDDGEVLELVMNEGDGVIVLTGDCGLHSRPGEIRLPVEAALRKVKTVVLWGRNNHHHPFEKTRALLAVWDDLKKIAESPVKGNSRYKLRRSPKNANRWELHPWPLHSAERRLARNGYQRV